MPIDSITDIDALGFILLVGVVAVLLVRVIPGAKIPPRLPTYTDAEITAYDRSLPKYFLVAILALALGGLHAVVKDLPPVYAWLTEAGHGGHMARDLANTHLVIVIGGTIAATGLIWYILPRIARRPLYSNLLATWSFWLTVVGAGGFYLSNIVLGIIFGQMAHNGIDYEAAKPIVGVWRVIPIAGSASIMGLGYWTFTAEIFLTIWAARKVRAPRPHGHLLKYIAIGGLGLFIGTVQGVIQVLPANEAWIQASAPAGEYIDPIAHAHVNLVTGTLSLVAALIFWFSTRDHPTEAARRAENRVFWTMVPGSLLFYVSFMVLGWTEGHLMTDQGYTYAAAVSSLGLWHTLPLMTAGILMLAGIWGLLTITVRRFWLGAGRAFAAAPLLLVAVIALVVGTSQGLVQILPPVKAFLVAAGEPGDAIPNAHAQLNMLGGVIPALLGLLLIDSGALLRIQVSRGVAVRVAWLVGAGIGIYWASAMATNVAMGGLIATGSSLERAVSATVPLGGLGMTVGAALYFAGFTILAVTVWRSTRGYRAEGWRNLWGWIAAYNGEPPGWRKRIPVRYLLAAEAAGAFVGWPGLGWTLSGMPFIGLPLLLGGPPIAWAVLPLLSSPFGDPPLHWLGLWQTVLLYLGASTILSVACLGAALSRRRRHANAIRLQPSPTLHGSEQQA